jgi:uncharacterized tellurite resistance protein B-like protein
MVERARWAGSGAAATIQGHRIESPFAYVGLKLLPTHSNGTSGDEPSLINPELRARAQKENLELPYWPTYVGMTPGQRDSYLRWLASGRQTDVAQGYLFVWFYGVERRLMWAEGPELEPAERRQLLKELDAVLTRYPQFNSFQHYAGNCIVANWLRATELVFQERSYLRELRIEEGENFHWVLSCLAASGRSVTCAVAMQWLSFSRRSLEKRVVVGRCWNEIEELFRIRFEDSYGGEISLTVSSAVHSRPYTPANLGLRSEKLRKDSVPRVSNLTSVISKLTELRDACIADLEPFSKKLGKSPTESTAEKARAVLPTELRKASLEKTRLAQWVAERVDGGPGGVLAQELYALGALGSNPSKKEYVELTSLLAELGFLIEPDPRFGSPMPDPLGLLFLARTAQEDALIPSRDYLVARAVAELGASVARADGRQDEDETEVLRRSLVESFELGSGEQERIQVLLRWLMVAAPKVTKSMIERLPREVRGSVVEVLVAVAEADGVVSVAEVQELDRLIRLMGIESTELFSRLHGGSEMVTVASEPMARSFAIPQGVLAPGRPRVVDMAAVRSKMRDTQEVAEMLAGIFVDEETERSEHQFSDSTATTESRMVALLGGLEAGQMRYRDFERLVDQCGGMPGAAIEALNDYAIDACGAPLIEGEDPLLVDGWVLAQVRG